MMYFSEILLFIHVLFIYILVFVKSPLPSKCLHLICYVKSPSAKYPPKIYIQSLSGYSLHICSNYPPTSAQLSLCLYFGFTYICINYICKQYYTLP